MDMYRVVDVRKPLQKIVLKKKIVPEEHKVHWFLADVIVLIEVILYHQSQFVYIYHLCIRFDIVLWIDKVTEHEAA